MTQQCINGQKDVQPVGRLRILAVDDEPSILEVLTIFLKDAGHHVCTAERADTALAKLDSAAWDLIITDRVMPGMNGDEFARAVKQVLPRTPVLMITGLPDRSGNGNNPAIDGMVRKPFTGKILRAAIERIADNYNIPRKVA